MSERCQSKGVSNRSPLENALDTQTDGERFLLTEYQSTLKRYLEEQEKLSRITSEIKDILASGHGTIYSETLSNLGHERNRIVNRINSYDIKLFHLEKMPELQNVLEREKEKWREKERQRGQEALAAYKEAKRKEAEEVTKRWKQQRAEYHFHLIDNAMEQEKQIKDKVEKECSYYENAEEKKLNTKKTLLLLASVGTIALLTAVIYHIFSFDKIWIPLIVSSIVTSFTALSVYSSVSDKHTEKIRNFKQAKEVAANTNITKMYSDLLKGVDVREFLGIPSDILFVDGQPSDTTVKDRIDPMTPYGSYTRYVSLAYGRCFHVVKGCSGATFPVNAIELSYNEYRIKNRQYTPCGVCVKSFNSAIIVPEWYPYWVKVKSISYQYKIEIK